MTTISRGNWSYPTGRNPDDDIQAGDVIDGGNFMQKLPDTPILVGKAITINGGLWVNVRQDPAWTINGGTWQQIDRCYHLHPNAGLDVEPDNCRHVTRIDTVTIDGETAITGYERKDTFI